VTAKERLLAKQALSDENLEEELYVNQYFSHSSMSCTCIHVSFCKLTFLGFSCRQIHVQSVFFEIIEWELCLYHAVACRDLVMPGATAWLYAPYQILVLSSGIQWSLLLDIRCLWRHNMTSCSRLRTNVMTKFVDTTCVLFYTHSPYSLLHNVSLWWT